MRTKTELSKQEYDNKMAIVAEILSRDHDLACAWYPTAYDTLTGQLKMSDNENPTLELSCYTESYGNKTRVSVSFPRASDNEYCSPHIGYNEQHYSINFSTTKDPEKIAKDLINRGLEVWTKENIEAYKRLAQYEEYLRDKDNTKERLIALGFEQSPNDKNSVYCPSKVCDDIHRIQINSDTVSVNFHSLSIDKFEKVFKALTDK